MRRHYQILLFILLLVSCTITAQPRLRTPEIYFGGHAGVMGSSMMFNPTIKGVELLNPLIGLNGGFVFRYAGHKVCAIQVEANYMQRGWKEQIGTINYTRTIDYLEVPLLMHLYFGGQHVRAFFNLGPQIGYCIRESSTGDTNPQYTHQYADLHKPFDWGLAAGLGIYYRTNNIGLFQLEARGNYSFGSIFNNRTTDYFEFANSINVSINLAYMWQFKVK